MPYLLFKVLKLGVKCILLWTSNSILLLLYYKYLKEAFCEAFNWILLFSVLTIRKISFVNEVVSILFLFMGLRDRKYANKKV